MRLRTALRSALSKPTAVLTVATLLAGSALAQSKTVPSQGGGITGTWSDWNLLQRRGYGDGASKINTAWSNFKGTGDPDMRLIFPLGSDSSMAYVQAPADDGTGRYRAVTEGQGWGMMAAVQMNDQTTFNQIWEFTKTYMQFRNDNDPNNSRYHYHRWRVYINSNGTVSPRDGDWNYDAPAPDGEIWIAAALLVASNRWGNGSGIYHYRDEAHKILQTMLYIESWNGSTNPLTNMFTNNQVVFLPFTYADSNGVAGNQMSDPSYSLPAFFDLFSRVGPSGDAQRWRDITAASRESLLPRSTGQVSSPPNGNASTGLAPNYSRLDGAGYDSSFNSGFGNVHTSDANRVGSNIGVDYMWWGDSSQSRFNFHKNFGNVFLNFLFSKNSGWYSGGYPYDFNRLWYPQDMTLNGTALYAPGNHEAGYAAMNAAAAQVATTDNAWRFVDEVWNSRQPERGVTYGDTYYNGCQYMLGLLEASGNFRPYTNGTVSSPVITVSSSSVTPSTTLSTGAAATASATFSNSGGAMSNGILGFRLFNSGGSQVNETSQYGVNIAGGGSQSLTWNFTAPTTAGTYTLYAAAWDANWNNYVWQNIATPTPIRDGEGGNLLTNGGFEANTGQSPTGWLEAATTNASYAENSSSAHGGSRQLAHYSGSAFQTYTYQTVNVANGTYTVRSWYRGGGSFNDTGMTIKGYNGGSEIWKSFKSTLSGTYQKMEQTNIVVTSGKIEIGFWTDAAANSWVTIDDVELIKQ